MEMASRVITEIRSTLDDLQLVREVYFEYEEQIVIKIVMHKLRGLITFLLCSARLDNNDSRCPGSQEDKNIDRQKRMKTGLESLMVRVEDICKVIENNEFDESLASMESLEEELDEWYTSLSDYLKQSCPSAPANQVIGIFDSVLVNLGDFLSFHIANVGSLVEPIEALKDNIAFLRNFICFASLLCAENMEFQDLLTYSDTLAINAAHLTVHLFSSSHYNYEVLYGDVENSRENLSPDRLKSMISAFSLKINFADNSHLYEAYSRALAGIRCKRELYIPILDMKEAVTFLLSILWGMLQLYAGPSVSFMDQLGALYKGLKSLANILNLQANKVDGNIRDIAGATIFDAGIIVFSLHQKEFAIDQGIQDFLDNIKVIQTEVGEQVGSSPKFQFPKTNIPGFLDFLLDYLKEVNSSKVDPDILSCVPRVQEHLVFLVSFVRSLQTLRNQQENIHQNLYDLALEVAFKIECLIDQLVLGNILVSFSASLQSITKDVQILKTESDSRQELKVLQEVTPASTHRFPSRSSIAEGDERIDTIELSYKCLPDHLKSCLLSFAAFPKDEEVSVKRLIWFWIAEGFVRRSESKSLQEVATDYLRGLIERGLVISVKERSGGGIKTCRVDDSVHAFCLVKSSEELFLHLLIGNEELSSFDEPDNLRRLCIYSKPEHLMKSKLFYPHLRSLLYFHPREWLEQKVDISFIFRIYKLLRVLDMEKVNIHTSDFPGEVGFLVQLRYLAIQATYDVSPSIGNLSNLEFLVLYPAREGNVTLPYTVWNLQYLRHVYLICKSNEFSGIHFPIDDLDNSRNLLELESLSGLHSEDWRIMEKQLRKFPNLHRLKCWLSEFGDGPLNSRNVMSFSHLSKLESLSLSFDGNSTEFEFCFPETLKKLALRGCGLPWEKISKIAELPNLEVLKLLDESFIGDTWHMGEWKFLKLTFLKMVSLSIVKWTAFDDQCPNLRKLILEDCPKLEVVPKCLESVVTLELIEVIDCPDSVSSLLRKVEDRQKAEGNSVLKLHMHSTRET